MSWAIGRHARLPASILFAPKDSRGDSADAFRIGDHVELGDPVIDDGEGHHGVRPPIQRDHDTSRPVDQCRMELCRWIGAQPRLPGHGRCAADHHGRSRAARAQIGVQDDIGVEQGDQRVQVTAAGCRKKASTTAC